MSDCWPGLLALYLVASAWGSFLVLVWVATDERADRAGADVRDCRGRGRHRTGEGVVEGRIMGDKLTDRELRDRLTDCPRVGQLYRHYKTNGTYRVVGSAIAESTQEPLVIYQNLTSDLTFARPLKEWRELVIVDGMAFERFRAVEA